MSERISMNDLLPFIEAAFAEGKSFTIPITGTSMLPLLVAGRDTVSILPPKFPLNIGDLPLYRRNDGSFVLHRVVKIENGSYTMCGDNQFLLEKGITDECIIGVVFEITRDGKTFSADDNEYSAYVRRGLKRLGVRYPVRRMKYNLHKLLNGKKQ